MQINNTEFKILTDYMKNNYGINLSKKKALIEGRLGLIIQKKGFNSFESFVDYVLNDKTGEAVTLLTTKLTTNFTYFMREESHYAFLIDMVLPDLVNRLGDKDLRIWSAGCSSGEEAYTLAIMIDDFFKGRKAGWDTTILATDISQGVLQIARNGIYGSHSLEKLPEQWKDKYFEKWDEDNYKIKDFIKNEVIFRYFNLMEPVFPFKKKFHVIFCRNVMIYFEKKTKEVLINKFYDSLDDGGYLFIGLSESLGDLQSKFTYVKPSIYRKGGI